MTMKGYEGNRDCSEKALWSVVNRGHQLIKNKICETLMGKLRVWFN